MICCSLLRAEMERRMGDGAPHCLFQLSLASAGLLSLILRPEAVNPEDSATPKDSWETTPAC